MKKTPVISVAMIAFLTACGSATNSDNKVNTTEDWETAETAIEPPVPNTVGDSEFSRNLNENFRIQFTTNFIKSCVTEALKSGAQESLVRPVCECTSSELLKRVNSYAESANPPEEKMMEAASFCFNELTGN